MLHAYFPSNMKINNMSLAKMMRMADVGALLKWMSLETTLMEIGAIVLKNV